MGSVEQSTAADADDWLATKAGLRTASAEQLDKYATVLLELDE